MTRQVIDLRGVFGRVRHAVANGRMRAMQAGPAVVPYLPGIFLIFVALALIAAPELFLLLAALLLLFTGLLVCLLTRKIVQLKQRIETAVHGFEAQVLIHRPRLREEHLAESEEEDSKKIILH